MRVIAFCFARNEQDIIEAFVRHTLVYCDELLVLDHGSTDATADILRSLKNEGLPLHLLCDPEPGLAEPCHTTRLHLLAAHEFSADWLLGLDADEFIDGVPDRSFLPEPVAHETPCLKLRLRNYYSRPDDRADVPNPVERLVHHQAREKWETQDASQYKVAVPGWMAREGGEFAMGKHQYFLGGNEASARVIDDAWLAHFSLRSPSQYAAKLVSKQINKYHHIPFTGDDVSFYDTPYEILRRSYAEFAAGFYNMRLSWCPKDEGEWVRGPMRYLGGPLRYTPQGSDTGLVIRDLLDFTERLARSKKNGVSPVEKPLREHRSVDVTAHPSPGHKSLQYPAADASNYQTVCLPLDCPPDVTGLNFCFCTGPGMIEIRRIELSRRGVPAGRVYDGKKIQPMIRVTGGGACIASPATQRILVSRFPLKFILSGWRNSGDELPDHVTIEFRHQTENLDAVFLNPQVLETINAEHNRFADAAGQEKPRPPEVHQQNRTHDAVCRPGEPVDFATDGNSRLYKREGWSPVEPWGTWTDGPRATLHFYFTEIPAEPLEMAVLARPMICEKQPLMTVEVTLNGELAATWQYDSDPFEWRKVQVPPSLLESGRLEVAFEIKAPVCPIEMKLSADARRLGIGVVKIEFQPPATAQSGGPS